LLRGSRVTIEQSRLVGEHDRLDAVADLELLKDVRDVRLDRGLADVELASDLAVRKPGVGVAVERRAPARGASTNTRVISSACPAPTSSYPISLRGSPRVHGGEADLVDQIEDHALGVGVVAGDRDRQPFLGGEVGAAVFEQASRSAASARVSWCGRPLILLMGRKRLMPAREHPASRQCDDVPVAL
jgi:hypothetical protein